MARYFGKTLTFTHIVGRPAPPLVGDFQLLATGRAVSITNFYCRTSAGRCFTNSVTRIRPESEEHAGDASA